MRFPVKTAGALIAVVGMGFTAEKLLVGRMRRRTDPLVDPLLTPPADAMPGEVGAHDGGKLHYLERGEGRPLVLLHGITLAARIWSPQLHQLAGSAEQPGFRVIACDLRGHGDSSAGTDGFGLPVLARDLATLLIELDLHDAIVVGHSMGGMALMRFCADHPDVLSERVAALGFVATASSAPMPPFLLSRLEILGARLVDRLDDGRAVPSLRFSGNDASLVLCRLAFGKNPSAAAVEQVRACIEGMGPEASQRSGIGLLAHDVSETLSAVTLPAAIVVGRRDLLTPVAAARKIARLLPHATFHVLDDAGHQIMQERPAELGAILRELASAVEAECLHPDDVRSAVEVITDIEGVRVGHWTDPVARTGCTVALLPAGTTASAEVRGGAPATRELDLLAPERLVDRLDAVLLTGGSAFGLAAADGAMRWCEQEGVGFPTSAGPVPIVVALGLFDLAVGRSTVRPGADEGYAACVAATGGPTPLGQVGAGTGATVGKWHGPAGTRAGGLGAATVRRDELVVAALVAVNAFGDIDLDGSASADLELNAWDEAPSGIEHTTIGLIVTNARLSKIDCLLVAQGGHDGMARSVVPVHSRFDGDALVAAATGRVDAGVDLVRLLAVAAVERAVRTTAG